MTNEEAINGFEIDNALLGNSEQGTIERNNLAIIALREQAERDKGCEYCIGEIEKACNDCDISQNDCQIYCERIKKYGLQQKIRNGDTFCRNCGHKLKEST